MHDRPELRTHLATILADLVGMYRAELVRVSEELLPRIHEVVTALHRLDSERLLAGDRSEANE
jgi:hypothetical protein